MDSDTQEVLFKSAIYPLDPGSQSDRRFRMIAGISLKVGESAEIPRKWVLSLFLFLHDNDKGGQSCCFSCCFQLFVMKAGFYRETMKMSVAPVQKTEIIGFIIICKSQDNMRLLFVNWVDPIKPNSMIRTGFLNKERKFVVSFLNMNTKHGLFLKNRARNEWL